MPLPTSTITITVTPPTTTKTKTETKAATFFFITQKMSQYSYISLRLWWGPDGTLQTFPDALGPMGRSIALFRSKAEIMGGRGPNSSGYWTTVEPVLLHDAHQDTVYALKKYLFLKKYSITHVRSL